MDFLKQSYKISFFANLFFWKKPELEIIIRQMKSRNSKGKFFIISHELILLLFINSIQRLKAKVYLVSAKIERLDP